MSIHAATFRGHEFRIQEGSTHPAYSVQCFTPEGEEWDFRERFWRPQAGQVVVDAGASYGAYALTAAACGAQVFAFEPEPTVLVDLRRNVDLNPGFNVRCFDVGLWDREDHVDMYSFAPHWPPGTITAPFAMVPLDSMRMTELDWLKIDVEGAEERVLRGAVETLKRCRPVCIVEAHVFLDAALADKCQAVLQECGYDSFEWVDRPPCTMVIARVL